jgi:CheY-like chemotaxis protein
MISGLVGYYEQKHEFITIDFLCAVGPRFASGPGMWNHLLLNSPVVPAPIAGPRGSEIRPSTMRILLVEDSDSLRPLFARMLRGNGIEVVEAADGLEALERLGECRPDLILTDLMMPQLDGIGLLRRLREMPGLESVPVVVISAMHSPSAETEARQAGAADFLAKPIDPDTLMGRVADCLDS